MTRRQELKEERRQQILEVALDLFIRKGYGACKITDIAKEANISNGLLFHYFSSKEELYKELVLMGTNGFSEKIIVDEEDLIGSLEFLVKRILDDISTNPMVAKIFVLVDQAQYLDFLPDDLVTELKKVNSLIKETEKILVKGQKAGVVRKGNAEALATCFWSAIQGYAQHRALDVNTKDAEASWFISMLTP